VSRRRRRALLGVALLAFALRAGWVALARLDPFEDDVFDATFYHVTATRLAAGQGYTRLGGAPTAVWPPGYPLLLAGVYAVSGGSVLAAKLANAAYGALAALFTYAIGARLFGARAGLLAALLFAACPDDVFYANFLLSEPAFAALFTGLLWLFVVLQQRRPGPGPLAWLAFGAAAGLATLTRGIALGWLAVPALVWLVQSRALRPAWPRAPLALAGLACALLPWTIRNQVQLGAPIPVASSSGRTLAHAHGPFETADGSLEGLVWRQQVARRYAHLPQPQQEVAIMREFTRLSLAWMLGHPGEEIALVPRRLLHLFGSGHRGLEIGRPKRAEGGRRPFLGERVHAWLAGAADLLFWALLALGLLGLPTCLRQPERSAWVVPLSLLYFTGLHVVLFPADPRYHAPMLPLLALSAGAWLAGRTQGGREPPAQAGNEPRPSKEAGTSRPTRSSLSDSVQRGGKSVPGPTSDAPLA
jgi:4-amino-4-deoxy-L-arabinose transferase-like glycosyltransferase